jgi:hypothetical protein
MVDKKIDKSVKQSVKQTVKVIIGDKVVRRRKRVKRKTGTTKTFGNIIIPSYSRADPNLFSSQALASLTNQIAKLTEKGDNPAVNLSGRTANNLLDRLTNNSMASNENIEKVISSTSYKDLSSSSSSSATPKSFQKLQEQKSNASNVAKEVKKELSPIKFASISSPVKTTPPKKTGVPFQTTTRGIGARFTFTKDAVLKDGKNVKQ